MNEVRNVATFAAPLHAIRNNTGRTVRILAVGDQEGKSPVYLVVDENGISQWETIRELRIVDTNALPASPEAFNRITDAKETARR